MKFNRRGFIKSASLLAGLTWSEIDAMAAMNRVAAKGKSVAGDNEKYWGDVRELFPLKKDYIYLNNGTVGPSPYPVIEAVHRGMMATDEYGKYKHGKETLKSLASFVGASKEEIAYTHNVTEGINIACWGVPLKRRDEVIMTTHEHVGNALPWLNRMKQDGIVIRTFTPAATADETLHRVKQLINKKTRVIAVPHIPCTQGQVLPIKDICLIAQKDNIHTFIDGAHGPGMLPIDVKDIGCDVYISCGHKWMLGPKGTGFIYVNRSFQDTLVPMYVGGSAASWELSDDEVRIDDYANDAHRYSGGTQNSGLLDGLVATVDFMQHIGVQNVYDRIKHLGQYTQEQLLTIGSKVKLLTPTEEESYCGINSFTIDGVNSKDFYSICSKAGIRVRYVPESDLHCVRVSTHIYNNTDDIDALIAQVKNVV